MNLGKTLFAQLMEFVPWTSFARIVARYSGDARVSTLPGTEHFRIMAYAKLTWRESLRDIEVTLGANANKLYADEPLGLDVNIKGNVYALDSSTIDLCLSLFDWAPFRSTKAAIKLHTLLDLRGCIPSFIHISDGKMGDVNVLDILPMEAGAFYIMDRGYLDFARLYTMHQAGAFFVTRAKSNFNARRLYSASVDKTTGVVCDQTMALNGHKSVRDYPEHLRIKKFLGTSEHAVKSQVWCAIATYVLIAIVKKELQLDASLYTCLQILSVSVFEKTLSSCALQPDDPQIQPTPSANQLILFGF